MTRRPTGEWLHNLTPDERNKRILDTETWNEREATRHERDFPAMSQQPTKSQVVPRDPKDVAGEFVAKIQGKLERGEYVDQADKIYALVLMLRHDLILASDLERRLRADCGWRQKDDVQPPAPEPYDQHAMGFTEQ